jgi:hypothetical protein
MAHRFIIDDKTGALYSDFTGRKKTTAAEILQAERGLTPTFEIFSVNVATDTRAVTTNALNNNQLSVAIGANSLPPDTGAIKVTWTTGGTTAESIPLNIKNLTSEAIAGAFNNDVYIKALAPVLEVEQIGLGKFLITAQSFGATTGNPSFNVEDCSPPTGVEVSQIHIGDYNTKSSWIISIARLPVASISSGSFSSISSGSFSGQSATISFNTSGMLEAIHRGERNFEFTITHNNQLLHRSEVNINESLDPTAAGTVIVTSPSIFTLGSNGVLQGETIALSGGLTYDGTTLNAPHLQLTGGTMSGAVAMGSQKITGLADGTASGDAINKGQLDGLIDNAPDALNTLNELAAALGDDVNFSTTVSTNIATKLPLAGGTMTGHVLFNDGIQAKFGTHADLTIQHDGNSYISENGTGDFYITTNDASIFLQDAGSGRVMLAAKGGSGEKIELNHSGSKKFETLSTGVKAYGLLETNSGGADSPSLKVAYDANNYLEFAHNRINGVSSGSHHIAFQTGGTEAARFDSSGHLLLNSTSSTGDVFQSTATDGIFAARLIGSQNSGQSNGLRIRAGFTSSDHAVLVENWSGTDLFKIKGDGSAYFNSQTTNTVATFESTDTGAGILLADDTGTSKLETSGAELRVSCDDNDAVNNSVIKFRLDGATKATLDSTGLGIGCTPSAKLDVQLEAGAWNVGSSFTNKAVRISGGSGGLGLAYDDTTGATIAAIHHGNSWKKLNFGAVEYHYDINGSEVMRLNSTGLGIGTTPHTNQQLHIASSGSGLEFSTSQHTNESRMLSFDRVAGAYRPFRLQSSETKFEISGTEAARFDSSGHFLIPDTNKIKLGDDSDLEIFYDTDSFIKSSGVLKLASDTIRFLKNNLGEYTANFYGDAGVELFYNGSKKFETTNSGININGGITFDSTFTEIIRTPNSLRINIDNDGNQTDRVFIVSANSGMDELFRVQENGKVGIGGTPVEKLTIEDGHIRMSDGYKIDWGGTNVRIDGSNADGYFRAFIGGSEAMRLNSTGLGIGGAPSEQLTNYSASGNVTTLTQVGGSGNADLQLKNNSGDRTIRATADKLWFIDNTDTRTDMVIDGSGNVGIGTTSPQQKAHIVGGGLQISGNITTPASGQTGLLLDYVSGNARYWSRGADASTRGTHSFYSLENDGGSQITSMFINSSGNVGINTTSFSNLLSVVGKSDDQTSVAKITRSHSSASNDTYTLDVDSSSHTSNMTAGGAFSVKVNSGKAFKINGNGDIFQNYINYTDESNYEALKIEAGTSSIKFNTTSVGSFSSNTRPIEFLLNGNAKASITGAGVYSQGHFYIASTGSLRNTTNHLNLTTSSQSDNDIIFKPNDSETVRITSDYFKVRQSDGKSVQIQASVGNEARILANNQDHGTALNLVLSSEQLKIKTDQGAVHSATFDETGDLELLTDGKGLILSSPDGTRYKITVANGGGVTSTAM